MTTTNKKHYVKWLEGMNYNYTATIRSVYPLTQIKLENYSQVLLNLNPDIQNIYSVIEPDTDPYSKAQEHKESYITTRTSTGNHAHLLLKISRTQKYLNTRTLNRLSFTVPYYDEIRNLQQISGYLVKYQTENNYNILLRGS